MGGFFIVRKPAGAARDAAFAAASASMRRQGFTDAVTFSAAGWVAALYPKQIAGSVTYHRDSESSFAFVSGTLFYNAQHGPQALREALRDHRTTGIDKARLRGAFCLVIGDGDKLRLLGDATGSYRVYRDDVWSILSNSFLAALSPLAAPAFDTQGVYQYVFNGATFGTRSPVVQLRQLGRGADIAIADRLEERTAAAALASAMQERPFAAHVERAAASLRDQFRPLAAQFGERIDTALSGGYDSRLLLALLRDAGVTPRVHVYGRDGDADVTIAKAIAAGEGFALTHIDKSAHRPPAPADFADRVAANFHGFDALPIDGIFDSGADLAARRGRADGGFLQLNGGGGEIYRNFHYLPDKAYGIRQFIWSFYSQFDPAACTARFTTAGYEDALADAIHTCLGQRDDRLSRWQVEALYPYFRCTYWMGRNNSINNRLAPALTPFIEEETVATALAVPLRYKQHGRFEAALIAAIDPRLARYPSAYGHDFATPPPLWRKAQDQFSLHRPAMLRRRMFALKARLRPAPPRPTLLSRPWLARSIDPALPMMSRFFIVERVRDNAQFARLCTLEYLAAQCGVRDSAQD